MADELLYVASLNLAISPVPMLPQRKPGVGTASEGDSPVVILRHTQMAGGAEIQHLEHRGKPHHPLRAQLTSGA